jgi:PAS domain S-box-containing protein
MGKTRLSVIKALYVDDEPGLLDIVKAFLELSGNFQVTTFSTAADALKALATEQFDVIISDYQMPVMDGIEFLKKVKSEHITTPFVLFTGKGREEVVIEAVNNGADFYIRKGTDTKAQFAELINVINQAVARKEAEEALTYNLRHFRMLIENGSDIIAEVDKNGKIGYVSPSIKRTLGLQPDELLDKNLKDLVHPDDSGKVDAILTNILEAGQGPSFELRLSTKDRAWKVIEVDGTRNNTRNPTIVINAHDVTERNRLVNGLKNLNRMHAFLSSINQAILHTPVAEELYQKCCQVAVKEGLFKMAWVGVLDPEGRVLPTASFGETGDYLNEILITVNEEPEGRGPCGTSIKTNEVVVCNDIANDKSALPWRERAAKNGFESMIMLPIRLHGKPIGAFGLYSEISDTFTGEEIRLLQEIAEDISLAVTTIDIASKRKMIEDALKESEGKYRTLFDHMREGFAFCRMIFDHKDEPIDWIYLKVNPAFYKLTGLEDIEGKSVINAIPGIKEMNPELFKTYGRVARTGLAEEFEIEFKPLKLSLKVSVFSPKPDHFIAVFEDITEYMHKMAEQRLTRKKFELLGQISRHDIFNQMLVINGITDVLRKRNDTEQLVTSFVSISEASEKIDRILQFGKEYEEIGIRHPVWIDIHRTLSRISDSFTQVNMIIDTSLEGVRVYADPLIERVFFNLFDNAVRHGVRTTEINVYRVDTGDEMIVAVKDNGFGISPEDKIRLFQYGQGKNSGFGLYLCREILAITGMTIVETGQSDMGAIFEVHVPLDKTGVVRQ